jgi:uncharacterized protein (DUF302 family)
MKKILLATLIMLLFSAFSSYGEYLKPYILGAESSNSVDETATKLKSNLESNGFKVVGEYSPAKDKNKRVIVVTSNALLSAVKKFGGLRGFAATIRLAVTKGKSNVLVSYINLEYWGNAYFQSDFSKVKNTYKKLAAALKKSMNGLGTLKNTYFGAKKGEEPDDLQDYHYMIMMPYFEDVNELKTFKSHKEAVKTIEKNLKNNKNMTKVYRVDIPGTDLTLYGIGLFGKDGEAYFLPKIDFAHPKHTAFLPYELLVKGKEVVMLHGKYRIAISFPDLSMGTFMKISGTPGDIEDMLESLTK